MFALLASSDPIDRFTGIGTIGERASDDLRVLPALLDRLEHDPDQRVRRTAAFNLRWSTAHDAVRQALQAAAADDENLEVRWAARYILRLADLASSQ
jgi:HEAT repeat protein